MTTSRIDTLDVLFIALIGLHLVLAPYTKVEESFNLQAIHDVFSYGISPDAVLKYDHNTFPGVVPRTFIGPLAIGTVMSCLRPLQGLIPLIAFQYIARGILGLTNGSALIFLRKVVDKTFGPLAGTCYLMLCCCQFHLIFYASRPLPNMFAFAPMVMAFSYWIRAQEGVPMQEQIKSIKRCIGLIVFTGVIFRFEVGGILVPLILLELTRRRITLIEVIKTGLATFIPSLTITLIVDSYFWQQLSLWPEGAVFYYNGIQGKSSEWGVSPWHSYFTTHLPKLLMVSAPLAMFATIIDRRARPLLLPAGVFVGVYSFIAHKEWRFIIYVVPLVNAVGGVGASFIIRRSSRTTLYGLISVGIIGMVLACFAASTGMMLISRLNYPGGQALARLHELETCNASVSVHIDTYTAMTGASLFGQLCPGWKYSKDETLGNDSTVYADQFTHILTHEPKIHGEQFDVMDRVKAYDGIQVDNARMEMNVSILDRFPIGVKMKDAVWTLKRLPSIPQ